VRSSDEIKEKKTIDLKDKYDKETLNHEEGSIKRQSQARGKKEKRYAGK
jgi:hypothetical protein